MKGVASGRSCRPECKWEAAPIWHVHRVCRSGLVAPIAVAVVGMMMVSSIVYLLEVVVVVTAMATVWPMMLLVAMLCYEQ